MEKAERLKSVPFGGYKQRMSSFDLFRGQWDKIIVPLIFIAIVLFFYLIDAKFLSATNLLNIMSQASILMVVTVAASLVIFTGGFDLSAGAMVALTGVVAALIVQHPRQGKFLTAPVCDTGRLFDSHNSDYGKGTCNVRF